MTFGARRGLASGAACGGGGRWKSHHRKNVYLSPYVEKPFNSKVIKSFVPELRSRKCFLCFGIPMLSLCVMDIMNVLRTGMNTSISHIQVWLPNSFSTLVLNKNKTFSKSYIIRPLKLTLDF